MLFGGGKNYETYILQTNKLWKIPIVTTQIVTLYKLWPNYIVVTKDSLQLNSNCDKTQIVSLITLWKNTNCEKNQILAKLKLWTNLLKKKSKCERTSIAF